ncbi:MAG: sigma 54-interacting transcriptional regulator [Terracidiphilus sp.]
MCGLTAVSCRVDPMELPSERILFGDTEAMRLVRERVEEALSLNVPIVIRGENGTGRKTMAQYIHFKSPRKDLPMLRLHCADLLAGMGKRGLPGADRNQVGCASCRDVARRQLAQAGTLLLEDVDVLEEQVHRKMRQCLRELITDCVTGNGVGSSQIRVLCTTRSDPTVTEGGSKATLALFESGKCIPLDMSALRDRRDDIPELVESLMQRLAVRFGRQRQRVGTETLNQLMQWRWPGNLTELENWVARFLILGVEDVPGARYEQGGNPVGRKPIAGEASAELIDALREGRRGNCEVDEPWRASYGALQERHVAVRPIRRRRHTGP